MSKWGMRQTAWLLAVASLAIGVLVVAGLADASVGPSAGAAATAIEVR